MGKYERQVRQGWMIYHDVVPMLEVLPSEDVKEVILALSHYSQALANDEPPPDFSAVESLMGQALCSMLAQRISRDAEAYKARCETNAAVRKKRSSTIVDQRQPSSTIVDQRQPTKLEQNRTELEQNGTRTEVEAEPELERNQNVTRTKPEPNVAEQQKKGTPPPPLLQLAEERVNARLDNVTDMDIQREFKNLQRAAELAKRYTLPDSPEVAAAVLDDALKFDWDLLEDALKRASAANSRERLSVNFYRTFLNSKPSSGGGSWNIML